MISDHNVEVNKLMKTLSVSAIQTGTVIDHIPAGQALNIMRLLAVTQSKQQVTVGLNLASKRLGLKDLIKIENRHLTPAEIQQIAIFAPKATINQIADCAIQHKVIPQLPDKITDILVCPNTNCITHFETTKSHFKVEITGKQVKLTCHYCEKQFNRDHIGEYKL